MAKYGTWTRKQDEDLLNLLGGQAAAERLLACKGGVTVTFTGDMADVMAHTLPVIDCDTAPHTPRDGWSVAKHIPGGQLIWDPSRITLYLSDSQLQRRIKGTELSRELAEQPVLNANVLDYLIRYPHLIPEEWKVDENGNTIYIYFFGTIYRDPDDCLRVRYLYFRYDHWRSDYGSLNVNWAAQNRAAAILAA